LLDYESIPDATTDPDWAKPNPEEVAKYREIFRTGTPEQKKDAQREQQQIIYSSWRYCVTAIRTYLYTSSTNVGMKIEFDRIVGGCRRFLFFCSIGVRMGTMLVTGASRGIGLELARQYVVDGWQVLAAARAPEGTEELAPELARRL